MLKNTLKRLFMGTRKIKGDGGLELAVAKAGSATILARLIGVTPAAICYWKTIPVNRVPLVEQVTGIPRHLLRPDFWQAPASSKPSEAA